MNILDYRELSQNGTDWTEAFRKAIAALAEAGGGEVTVPSGVYPTGPIRLESDITLRVQNGARLVFHADEERFPLVRMPYQGRETQVRQACIYARDAKNVCLAGEGTLDGRGKYWWTGFRAETLAYPRPYMICFDHCSHVRVQDVTLVNSPFWTVHPYCCEDVAVQGITIHNPWDSPNTDGINPDSCRDVRITDCTVDVGDDCITLKAGTEDTVDPPPCERIIISGCHLLHGHGGIVLGSETSGGIRNVVVSNCILHETDRGIRLKTRRGRGGTVEGLQVFNLIMDGVMCPFVFNMYYYCGPGGKEESVRTKAPQPIGDRTPVLRDVSISGVSARNCTACAGFFYGLSEQPVEGVTMRDVRVEMASGSAKCRPAMMDDCPEMSGAGFFLRNVRRACFSNVTVLNGQGEAFDTDSSVELDR